METEAYPLELVALLKTTLPSERNVNQALSKKHNRRNGTRQQRSSRFGAGSDLQRTKYAIGDRTSSRDAQRFVFASPKFQLKRERDVFLFDESAPDQDSATVVSVVDSFNPYTSLESGSFSGTSYASF